MPEVGVAEDQLLPRMELPREEQVRFLSQILLSTGRGDKWRHIYIVGTFYLDLFGNNGNSLFTKNRGIGTILNDD